MSAVARYLSGRRRRPSRRAHEITEAEFADLLAGKQGTSVGAKRAFGLAAWYSGVRYLAESFSYLPVTAFRGTGPSRVQRSLPLWLVVPERDANGYPLMTRGRLFESWIVSVLHRGNAYGFKLRDDMGRVLGMRYIHPDRVKVRIEDGAKRFDIDVDGKGHRETFSSFEIFHFVNLSEDGVVGISPIEAHGKNLAIAVAADEFAGKYFEQGGTLSAYFKLNEKANTKKPLEELRAELDETYKGIQNANQVGVLSAGIDYETVTLNARDTQVLEARQWSVLEIARILRVPPHKLYDLTRATFANIEQQAIEAVGDGPRIWAERFEEQIPADPDLIAAGGSIEFNLEALTRGDTIAETNLIRSATQTGYMTLEEARRRRGLPDAPGMDVYYRPANVHVVDATTGEVIIPSGAPVEDVSDSDDDDPDLAPDETGDQGDIAASNGGRSTTTDELAELVAES